MPSSPARSRALALAVPLPIVSARAADFLELTKPRLNLLVVATTLAGYYLGADGFDGSVAGEHGGRDRAGGGRRRCIQRDSRARHRRADAADPHAAAARRAGCGWRRPSGSPPALSVAGLALLAAGANGLAAGVAAATLLSYALIYTPLKAKTPLATLVGGVPGALPPMIGWAAATRTLSHRSVGAVRHRLPVADAALPRDRLAVPRRLRAGRAAACCPSSNPTAAAPRSRSSCTRRSSCRSACSPTIARARGARLLRRARSCSALAFLASRRPVRPRADHTNARRLFLGSIIYLPLLWGLMLGNTQVSRPRPAP